MFVTRVTPGSPFQTGTRPPFHFFRFDPFRYFQHSPAFHTAAPPVFSSIFNLFQPNSTLFHYLCLVTNITIKRIYDPKEPGDGYRVLVDRLWPRGISKEKASWDEWLKNIAPSTALRQWFAHDPVRWDAFRKKYDEELDGNGEAVSHLLRLARKGKVTLLYSARNTEHNEAAALRDYLLQRFAS